MGTVDPDSTNALHRALHLEHRLTTIEAHQRRLDDGLEQLSEVTTTLAVLQAEVAAARDALEIKAKEYDRHFALLNNEAERILAHQNASVPRELYEVHVREGQSWRQGVDKTNARVQLIGALIVIALGVTAPFALRLTGS